MKMLKTQTIERHKQSHFLQYIGRDISGYVGGHISAIYRFL